MATNKVEVNAKHFLTMKTIGKLRKFRRPEVRNIMDIDEDNSSIPSSSFQGTMIFDKKARQQQQHHQQQQQQQQQQHRCSIYSEGQWDKSVPRRYFQKYPSNNEQPGEKFTTFCIQIIYVTRGKESAKCHINSDFVAFLSKK
jgi:hypothetical protein